MLLAVAAAAAFPSVASGVELAPGVVYKREVRSIGGHRTVVHILKAPKPSGLYDLKPVLSNGLVTGRETVSSMQRRLSSRATVAGVNGDLFNWGSGRPSGIFLRKNLLATRAMSQRSSLGIGVDGILRTGLVRYTGTWQFGSNKLRILREFNHPLEQDSGVVLYSPTWGPRTRGWLARLDHAGVYPLIAGSYAPFGLLVLSAGWAVPVLAVVWTGALVAILVKLFWLQTPKWLSAAIGLALGWIGAVAFSQLLKLPSAALVLIILAGVLYTAGAVVYALRRPDPHPRVFGYHELFHVLTVAATLCEYLAVALFVLPRAQ